MTKKEREKLLKQLNEWGKEKGIKKIDPLDLIPGAGVVKKVKGLEKTRKSLMELLKKIKKAKSNLSEAEKRKMRIEKTLGGKGNFRETGIAAKKADWSPVDSLKEISDTIKGMLSKKDTIKGDMFKLQEEGLKKKADAAIKKSKQSLSDLAKENEKLKKLSERLDDYKTSKKTRTDLEDKKNAAVRKLVHPVLEPDKVRSKYKIKGLDRSIADIERENSTLRNLINKAKDTDATKVVGASEKDPVKLNAILKRFLKNLTKEKVKAKLN